MMQSFRNAVFGCLVVWATNVPGTAIGAGIENCYAKARIPTEKQVLDSSTVVLLDETTMFDKAQQNHIRDQLTGLVNYGSQLRVFAFSAFIDGHYTVPLFDVKIASQLGDATRYTMRKNQLRDFDTCQEVALIRTNGILKRILNQYFNKATDTIARSDILSTLHDVGGSVFTQLRGKHKRLIIISDMLENSDVSSFYFNKNPRAVNVAKELASVEKQRLFTDFRGASVYVIGAGIAPIDRTKSSSTSYRPLNIMAPLNEFWQGYFEKSNARMAEFGKPLLLGPIGVSK